MKMLYILTAAMALMLASFASQATMVKANYSVDANTGDPGLVIHTAGVADNPFSYNLAAGDSVTFDLFDIWTDEDSLDSEGFLGFSCGDDCDPMPIKASFNFILPASNMIAVNGETQGDDGFLGFIGSHGELTWDGPESFLYGPNGDGKILVALSDETFNAGIIDLHPGRGAGATVQATITLVRNATAVPGPSGLALFGFLLLGLGVFLRRKRRGWVDSDDRLCTQ